MIPRRAIPAILLGLFSLLACSDRTGQGALPPPQASAATARATATAASPGKVNSIGATLEPLQRLFQRDAGSARLLALVSPT